MGQRTLKLNDIKFDKIQIKLSFFFVNKNYVTNTCINFVWNLLIISDKDECPQLKLNKGSIHLKKKRTNLNNLKLFRD